MSSISFYPQNGSVKAGETEAAISLTMRKEHQGTERKSQVFEVRKLVPALLTPRQMYFPEAATSVQILAANVQMPNVPKSFIPLFCSKMQLLMLPKQEVGHKYIRNFSNQIQLLSVLRT